MATDIKRETLREAGYKYVKKLTDNEHLLIDTTTGAYEIWFNNKGHAGYGLRYKGTDLEFARSYSGWPN